MATVDLRNLGNSRTLVLSTAAASSPAPGRRAVDLNTIPADFIERVELLTGGASAAYGSDAVAGVVNIIFEAQLQRPDRGRFRRPEPEEHDDPRENWQ